MSWSRIHRGLNPDTFIPFRYSEFGPDGNLQPPDRFVDKDEHFSSQPTAVKNDPSINEEPATESCRGRETEEAYSRGRSDGRAESEENLGKTANALAKALEEISRLRESLLKNSTQDMLNLILVIAKQVLQTELALNSNVILETIENALQVALRADRYHILVNEADLATVEEAKPLFLARINGLKNISFSAMPDISRGGCKVESEFGEVDATIESQFEVIRNTLSGSVEEKS
ncbi:MAG TPA: flagellar assembly protein FliH [Desulfuromonadales bacterium]|nr:flagellar assembly protein FliH [Desulfuromonadales bacterium]